MRPSSSGLAQWLLFVALALGLGGCAGLTGILRDTPDFTEQIAESPPPVTVSVDGVDAAEVQTDPASPQPLAVGPPPAMEVADSDPLDLLPPAFPAADGDALETAQQSGPRQVSPFDAQIEEYDPWEPFNEAMFEFNRGLDRWILKPVAKGYNFIMPNVVQEMIGNGFDNIRFVPRLVSSLLQGKWDGAGREFARFLVNSTLGIGGLFDVAKKEFGIQKSNEDMGQTLGVWGAGPGPYLVLPFLPPLTVRDGIGYAADMAMDPLGYVLPFIWDRFGMMVGDTVNDRSFNLDLYQGFEETTVEFYSALRNAYLQRRQKLIKE